VGGGVPVRRAVAARDVAARLTHAEVNPSSADLETVLATGDLGRDPRDLYGVEVPADYIHPADASMSAVAP
jgi:hypothetical protein